MIVVGVLEVIGGSFLIASGLMDFRRERPDFGLIAFACGIVCYVAGLRAILA